MADTRNVGEGAEKAAPRDKYESRGESHSPTHPGFNEARPSREQSNGGKTRFPESDTTAHRGRRLVWFKDEAKTQPGRWKQRIGHEADKSEEDLVQTRAEAKVPDLSDRTMRLAREGWLENRLFGGQILRAEEVADADRLADGSFRFLEVREGWVQTVHLDLGDEEDEHKRIDGSNLFFIRLPNEPLPTFHFWRRKSEPDPLFDIRRHIDGKDKVPLDKRIRKIERMWAKELRDNGFESVIKHFQKLQPDQVDRLMSRRRQRAEEWKRKRGEDKRADDILDTYRAVGEGDPCSLNSVPDTPRPAIPYSVAAKLALASCGREFSPILGDEHDYSAPEPEEFEDDGEGSEDGRNGQAASPQKNPGNGRGKVDEGGEDRARRDREAQGAMSKPASQGRQGKRSASINQFPKAYRLSVRVALDADLGYETIVQVYETSKESGNGPYRFLDLILDCLGIPQNFRESFAFALDMELANNIQLPIPADTIENIQSGRITPLEFERSLIAYASSLGESAEKPGQSTKNPRAGSKGLTKTYEHAYSVSLEGEDDGLGNEAEDGPPGDSVDVFRGQGSSSQSLEASSADGGGEEGNSRGMKKSCCRIEFCGACGEHCVGNMTTIEAHREGHRQNTLGLLCGRGWTVMDRYRAKPSIRYHDLFPASRQECLPPPAKSPIRMYSTASNRIRITEDELAKQQLFDEIDFYETNHKGQPPRRGQPTREPSTSRKSFPLSESDSPVGPRSSRSGLLKNCGSSNGSASGTPLSIDEVSNTSFLPLPANAARSCIARSTPKRGIGRMDTSEPLSAKRLKSAISDSCRESEFSQICDSSKGPGFYGHRLAGESSSTEVAANRELPNPPFDMGRYSPPYIPTTSPLGHGRVYVDSGKFPVSPSASKWPPSVYHPLLDESSATICGSSAAPKLSTLELPNDPSTQPGVAFNLQPAPSSKRKRISASTGGTAHDAGTDTTTPKSILKRFPPALSRSGTRLPRSPEWTRLTPPSTDEYLGLGREQQSRLKESDGLLLQPADKPASARPKRREGKGKVLQPTEGDGKELTDVSFVHPETPPPAPLPTPPSGNAKRKQALKKTQRRPSVGNALYVDGTPTASEPPSPHLPRPIKRRPADHPDAPFHPSPPSSSTASSPGTPPKKRPGRRTKSPWKPAELGDVTGPSTTRSGRRFHTEART